MRASSAFPRLLRLGPTMKRILLSAFACDPTRGSEPSCGWNWAAGLADRGFEVHCITRAASRAGIETQSVPPNLKFHYVSLPFGMERLYTRSESAIYLYYLIWQWMAYRLAVGLHKSSKFDMAHHVTWGNLQMGSFMYKLGIPLVFGPAGGGQVAPIAFRSYFGEAWSTETNRARVSRLLLRFNPACRTMLRKAAIVLASNTDTLRIAERAGARASLALDVGVPDWFLPRETRVRVPEEGTLKLLWVGRFMPRKGLLLLLEVMRELKGYPGITLTVVGDGSLRQQFLETVVEYGLENTVRWEGWVPFAEVRSHYADHDVFVFTSLRESGGVQLVEAMAFGMPVVTLDLHGPGLIVDSDRGIKCSCETPAIAVANVKNAVLELYHDRCLVRRLSEGSSRFAAAQVWRNKIDMTVARYYP